METVTGAVKRILPCRRITGMSAVLLPFNDSGQVDWVGFDSHVTRTFDAGLQPAVNMDTGYINLIDDQTRLEVLRRTNKLASGRTFVAGAFVGDSPDSQFNSAAYATAMQQIQDAGGTPVIFQSFGLTRQPDDMIVESYRQLAAYADRFIGFELGRMFAPFGQIYTEQVYRGLLGIRQCIGAKHSSLERSEEWQRLTWRDDVRPDFLVLTGNDLAIDMVMYGSDYLLGLSSFAPDLFALRDRFWQEGDAQFYQLNDVLQYLGFLAFRSPVPAYKHAAAMFLQLRGWIKSSTPHPAGIRRPESDRELLAEILAKLERWI